MNAPTKHISVSVPIVRSRAEIIAQMEARKEAKRQREGHFDALYALGEQIQSCGVSITEAAFRGNDQLVGYHVKEARLMILSAIEAVSLQGTKKDGWVKRSFFEIFDTMPPWSLQTKRSSPCATLRSWVKSRAIAYSKARKKYGDGGFPHAAE